MQRRKEQNIQLMLRAENVEEAVCKDPNKCAFAQPLLPIVRAQFGERAAETLKVDYETSGTLTDDDHVTVVFDGEDGRHYDGIINGTLARRVVFLNDANKSALVKDLKKSYPDGLPFTVEEVGSRNKQTDRKPADTTTLRYAKDTGYRHGRAKQPATSRQNFIDSSSVYASFTGEQRNEYVEGYALGLAKGPMPVKRKPRRSGSNKGRFGLIGEEE